MRDRNNKFIYLVENNDTKDMDDDGEFLWDQIEEREKDKKLIL